MIWDLQSLGTFCAFGLSLIAMIISWGKRAGIKEAEVDAIKRDMDAAEKSHGVIISALHARFDLIERQTSERFERTGDKVNEALLTMAREHPTKRDLHELESRIIGHIDLRFGKGHAGNPRPGPHD